jgi:hypothetical protein
MSPLELREKIHAQLDQVPEVELPKIQQYLNDLTTASMGSTSPKTGASLLEALKSMGTWQGDDFEECRQAVYDSRSATKFVADEHNPFN